MTEAIQARIAALVARPAFWVALIALVTVMIATSDELQGLAPGTVYGNGIGRFLTLFIGEEHLAFARTFGALAFSTFVFDTLDVSARLGRYLLQELFGWRGRAGAIAATLITVAAPMVLLLLAEERMWMKFWTLFGASNQLLAALTLLAITIWLWRTGRAWAFTALPMQVFLWTSMPQRDFLINAAAGIVCLMVTLLLLNSVAIFLRNRYQKRTY